ncbi:transcription termination factor MTERF4, chloroplastic-like [Oryza brachyantha]|uniref:transcription termination factor MTERF4, chloroplastic-like n=1 Tax=Oryza brachyantha TaxID=4533 RepID=UPI0003EA7F5C|nr:transcription termination factor MTERF4, chloroplastic-like [Oryza brachyantha]
MFTAVWRRRLAVPFPQIRGGAYHFQPNPHAVLLAHAYSTATVSGGRDSEPCPDTISYLVSCGLTPAAARQTVATARGFRIRSTQKADAVRALLRSHGFSDADVARIARGAPLLLTVDPDRIVRPKLEFFASIGFEPSKLATVPLLLSRSLHNHIVPTIQFLRGVIGTDDEIRRGFSNMPRALQVNLDNCMRPAVEALRQNGLTSSVDLSRVLVFQLGVLMLSPARIAEIFEDLKAMGMPVTDRRFAAWFRAMCSMRRETWLRKVALYRSFGLSESELFEAIKKQPTILLGAEETIKRKALFFREELNLEMRDAMANPVFVAYSLEKTILPRCAVLSVLMRKGKIKPDIQLPQALYGSDKTFTKKYVQRYAADVPDVVKAYEGKIKFKGFKGTSRTQWH